MIGDFNVDLQQIRITLVGNLLKGLSLYVMIHSKSGHHLLVAVRSTAGSTEKVLDCSLLQCEPVTVEQLQLLSHPASSSEEPLGSQLSGVRQLLLPF